MAEDIDLAVSDDELADPDENLALVALTPSDMPEQQRKLSAWCDRKIDLVERELAHWVALQDEAVAGGFKHTAYSAGANRTAKRIDYYKKIKAAVDAGYLIVPNMPTRTFAVRVKRATPARKVRDYESSAAQVTPDLLPAGEGRYVDETSHIDSETYPDTNYKGEPITKTRYFATEFDEDVDFPLQGVMPEVLRATSRAMALRLFDQLGVVQNDGGRDPIVVGQLLDPRGRRLTTFFVAWWLNTASL